jgi:hypothetical protein
MQTSHLIRSMLSFALAAGLAGCDEKAPTNIEPASATDVTGADMTDADATAMDVAALAIGLPVNQSIATTAPAPAFRINQTGTGPNGIFQISGTTNALAAVEGRTKGSGFGVKGIASGNGTPGAFRITSATNAKAALVAKTVGNGPAGLFETTNIDNPSPLLVIRNVGTGHAIHARTNNDGDFVEAVGRFEAVANGSALFATAQGENYTAVHIRNSSSFAPALDVSGRHAAQFAGDVRVQGTLTKTAGSFRIDHPLDPEHKYLSHSFVESPDMMNVYNGNVTLDAEGRATVDLPDYFEALNRDFRYQLTPIGAPGPNLYIAEGVKQNRFRIAGGRPYARVSWQVTGVRQDAYAEEHRIKVEENKP